MDYRLMGLLLKNQKGGCNHDANAEYALGSGSVLAYY